METKVIEVMDSAFENNERLAEVLNKRLDSMGVFAVNVLGGAGAGKTSVLIRLIEKVKALSKRDVAVIEGDIESDIDTKKLKDLGVNAWQINTGGNCHLESVMIEAILGRMSVNKGSVLFIENIGNLVCPSEFNIGEHVKLLVCSVPEGSDKPYKYPLAFRKAGAIVLTKADLAPYIDFDRDFFMKGVRALNPVAPVFEVSARTGEGFDGFAAWFAGILKS